MTASLRALILAAGHCACDPTRGQSCRFCDGTDDADREAARTRRAGKRAEATR